MKNIRKQAEIQFFEFGFVVKKFIRKVGVLIWSKRQIV